MAKKNGPSPDDSGKREKYSSREFILPPFAEDPILLIANGGGGTQTPSPARPDFWREFKFVGTKVQPPGAAIIRAYVAQLLSPKLGAEISRSIAHSLTPEIIGKIRSRFGKQEGT